MRGRYFSGNFALFRRAKLRKSRNYFLGETYKPKEKTGIIRVNSKYVDEAKVALASIREVAGQKATFDVIKASGNVGKLK